LTLQRIVGYTSDMSETIDKPGKLDNVIQLYPWGSRTLIPELLGIPNRNNKPHAEVWMGVHPRGPSKITLRSGKQVALAGAVEALPVEFLGASADKRFGGKLPFLFKVLAAEQPLSIQAHPDRQQAEDGFDREEKLGLAVDDYSRNYRDRNHKPEIICALTPFTAMCGFREPQAIHSLYGEINSDIYRDQVAPSVGPENEQAWIKEFFTNLMKLPGGASQILVEDVIAWASGRGEAGEGSGFGEASGREEAGLIQRFAGHFGTDPGIQAPLFLNIVRLKPGEALYQPAGVLHAYVQGMGVELMANSDNVLRGGLTQKHVDTEELLKVLSFVPGMADVQAGTAIGPFTYRYEIPIDEFELLRVHSRQDTTIARSGRSSVEICLCTSGKFSLLSDKRAGEGIPKISRGESFVVPYSFGGYSFSGQGTIYIATIPQVKG